MLPYVEVGGIVVNTYIVCVICAVLTALILFRSNIRRYRLSAIDFAALALVASLGASIGLPLAATLDIGGWEALWRARLLHYGTSFYGGLCGALIAAVLYGRLRRLPMPFIIAAGSAPILLAYAVGRVGCLLSGDGCYGCESSLPWAMAFPRGIIPTVKSVHPTPLYESLMALVLVPVVQYRFRKATTLKEVYAVIALAAFALGASRFMVELLRLNPLHWGLTQAQWISLGFLLLAFWIHIDKVRPASESNTNCHC